jgi:hypothetical protein
LNHFLPLLQVWLFHCGLHLLHPALHTSSNIIYQNQNYFITGGLPPIRDFFALEPLRS